MTRLLCRLGFHRWGAPYLSFWPDKTKREWVAECKRCRLRKVMPPWVRR